MRKPDIQCIAAQTAAATARNVMHDAATFRMPTIRARWSETATRPRALSISARIDAAVSLAPSCIAARIEFLLTSREVFRMRSAISLASQLQRKDNVGAVLQQIVYWVSHPRP
jgi:hypothetical protein